MATYWQTRFESAEHGVDLLVERARRERWPSEVLQALLFLKHNCFYKGPAKQ